MAVVLALRVRTPVRWKGEKGGTVRKIEVEGGCGLSSVTTRLSVM